MTVNVRPQKGDTAIVFGVEWKVAGSTGSKWDFVALERATTLSDGQIYHQTLEVMVEQLEGLIPKPDFARVHIPEDAARLFVDYVRASKASMPKFIIEVADLVAAAIPPPRETLS